TNADRISLQTEIGYEETVPGRIFRSWEVNSGPDFTFNHGGDLIDAGIGLFARGEFQNYWEGELRFFRFGGTLNDRLTRGGPLTHDPVGYSAGIGFESDPRWAVAVRPEIDLDWSPAGEWSTSLEVDVEWRPLENVSVELEPEVSRSMTKAQYVGSVDDPFAERTYGSRYLFADLRQTEVALSTRLN